MKTIEQEAEEARAALQEAVDEALDRKRRLGQYAVIWRNGEVVRIGPAEIARILRQSKKES